VDAAGWLTSRSALARAAILLGAAALILAVLLGLGWVITRAVPGSGLGGFDPGIDGWLAEHRTPTLDLASTVATDVCSTTSVFVLGFLAAACSAALLRRWWPAVFLAVALVGELWLFLATAMIVKRPRPPVAHVDAALPPTSSFPSGHTAAAICLYGGIAALVLTATRAWWRWLVLAAAVVVVALVAGARLYRGAHFPTDVLGSVVFALPWLLVVHRLVLPDARSR
jgi:undecaprenyl-diphosphatase